MVVTFSSSESALRNCQWYELHVKVAEKLMIRVVNEFWQRWCELLIDYQPSSRFWSPHSWIINHLFDAHPLPSLFEFACCERLDGLEFWLTATVPSGTVKAIATTMLSNQRLTPLSATVWLLRQLPSHINSQFAFGRKSFLIRMFDVRRCWNMKFSLGICARICSSNCGIKANCNLNPDLQLGEI